MVLKENIVKVPVEWPENKTARLSKACPRNVKSPRGCETCPWFAGYWDIMSRNIDFIQRWLGTHQRRIAYVQCGAPPEIRKPREVVKDDGAVVGLSKDSPEFEETLKAQVAENKPEPPAPEPVPAASESELVEEDSVL